MSKDPAFLFYYQDFLVGTDEFTNEEVGAYIRCLCHQAHKGFITDKHMKNICNSHEVYLTVLSKFVPNNELSGLINMRLQFEVDKRKKFTESRANNRKGKIAEEKEVKNICNSYEKHMENENEIENKDKTDNKNKESLKALKDIFESFRLKYPGTKRGLSVEWNDFIKSNKAEVAAELMPALDKEIEYRLKCIASGTFIANWKHLKTWINQKCWTQEFGEVSQKPSTPDTDTSGPRYNGVYDSTEQYLKDRGLT